MSPGKANQRIFGDLIAVRNALADWVTTHPESINSDL